MIDSLVKRAVAFGLCALVAPALAVAGQPDTDRYIVKFSDTARGKAALKAHGGSVLLHLGRRVGGQGRALRAR